MSCNNVDPCSVPGVSCDCPPFIPVPGPPGAPGQSIVGPAGDPGQNAFTTLSSQFVQPNVGATIVANVVNSTWLSVGSYLFIQGGGFYRVSALPNSTSVTLLNLGGTSNVAPTTVVPNAAKVVAAGKEGPALISPLPITDGGTGQSNATDAFDALSPLSVTGDLISLSGGSNVRIPTSTSGFVFTANGAATLPSWQINAPIATNITGILPVANGGTNSSTAAGARTSLGTAGLVDNNTYTGNNSFTGASVQSIIATFPAFVFSSALRNIYDNSGIISIDASSRFLRGLWTQEFKSFTNANSSTFSTWTNVETVISTYSSTGTQAITLPDGTNGRVCRIVDGAGNSSANPITISRTGGDTIMGSTSAVISLNYGTLSLIYLAATTTWIPCP